jgi:hypothetical protein
MGIIVEFTVGCIGVLTAGATTMELDGEHRTACAGLIVIVVPRLGYKRLYCPTVCMSGHC